MDTKGLGYIISIISVFLLGAVAWPKPGDPNWIKPALIGGMAASVIGMALRYVAHRKERRQLREAQASSSR